MTRRGNQSADHYGVQWPSEASMCAHWGVPRGTYQRRKRDGWHPLECIAGRSGRSPLVVAARQRRNEARARRILDRWRDEFYGGES